MQPDRLHQRPVDAVVDASVGTVGHAYDNALAESQIGPYEATDLALEGHDHVEIQTLDWVPWFITEGRTSRSMTYPGSTEQLHYTPQARFSQTG